MGSPYDIEYEVTEEDGPICFGGVEYKPGEVMRMKPSEFGCFRELLAAEPALDCCFPPYCAADGYPTKGYRDQIEVAPGEVGVATVPVIEGCRPAETVSFHYCPTSCVYVGYNADPVVGAVADGTAGDPNPTVRDLIEKGVCVETIHIFNCGADPVKVTLSYYC